MKKIFISILLISVLILSSGMLYAENEEDSLEEGLIAQWTFDDNSYGWSDKAGEINFNNDIPEGVPGKAVYTNKDSYLILGDSEELKPVDGAISVAFWVRRTGPMDEWGWHTLINATTAEDHREGKGWCIGTWEGEQIIFVADDGDRIRWDTSVHDLIGEDWNHFVFVYSDFMEKYKVFKNGEEVATFEEIYGFFEGDWNTVSITAHDKPVSLGGQQFSEESYILDDTQDHFSVPLDFADVRIYERVLTEAEIQEFPGL